MPQRILVLCRDRDLAAFLRLTFISEGYGVTLVRNSTVYLWALRIEQPVLAVIDLTNPEPRTLAWVQRASRSNVPLLTLLPASDFRALEAALEQRVDDYVLAPFRPTELRLRAQALVRRNQEWKERAAAERTTPAGAEVALDAAAPGITVGGRHTRLTPAEFLVLSYLVENSGRVIGESEIISQVWGKEMTSADLLLAYTVSRLRDRIEPDPAEPRHILSLEKSSYVFLPAASVS